jgi:uncharacterized protein (TIGR00730 family)
MKRITVFCGSSAGTDPIYVNTAFHLGSTLAKNGIGVVYGGAKIGLMGAVADGALSAGGEVIGVLPDFLRTVEIEHTGLTELFLVNSMHQRKAKMDMLSDGVIALPGGFGTLEELFEMLTWGQLGLHKKPIALLNVNQFYDGLFTLLQNMVDNGLLKSTNQDILLKSDSIDELLNQMRNYRAPETKKWISKTET